MAGAFRSFQKAWLDDWKSKSFIKKYLPFLLILTYWVLLLVNGHLSSEHFLFGGGTLFFYYLGKPFKRIAYFIMPLALTGLIYDGKRYFIDGLRATVKVKEPYLYEKMLFGVNSNGKVITLNEWFIDHLHPILDVITGLVYLLFIVIFLITAAYYVFYLSKKGNKYYSKEYIHKESPKMMWSFFWTNALGYFTYFWYPAAPPWYVEMHGLGPAKMDTPPNAARCLRFDELFNTDIFYNMYSKGADIFGAIPSLHCAYPMVALYFAFKFKSLRVFATGYFLLMCFSAVYLNHHYVIDAIWGAAYALIVPLTIDYLSRKNLIFR